MSEAGTEKIITLTDEIVRLDAVSWKIDTLLFGDRPVESKQSTLAGDKIIVARNKIAEITDRLQELAKRLETI